MELSNKTKLIISVSSNPTNFGVTIYNHIFSKLNLNYLYLPFKTEEDKNVINAIRTLNLVGCSVSSPLKSRMIAYMDNLDENTKKLNNLNTIKNIDGKLHGFNTDYLGFKKLIENLNLGSALIYGNGSVAKTILKVLNDLRFENIYLAGRNLKNIKKFSNDNSVDIFDNQDIDLLINATPSGTDINNDDILKYLEFCKIVIDLNVTKKDTLLVEQSMNKNLMVYKGSEMSINQLREQFKIYTDILPNEELVEEALQLYLSN